MDRHDNGDGSGGILGSTDCRITVHYQDIDFEMEKLPPAFPGFFQIARPHIAARLLRSYPQYIPALASFAEKQRTGSCRIRLRPPTDNLSDGLCPFAAPRRSLQRRATRRQSRLMAPRHA